MYTTSRCLRFCAVASALALAGCIPSLGPGLQLGVSPGTGRLHFGTSSCSLLGQGASPFARFSPTASAFAPLKQVENIHAQYAPGFSDVRAREARWKQLARGEC
jgi:hypothetical protein